MGSRALENRINKIKALEEQRKALDDHIEALKEEIKADMISKGAEELQAEKDAAERIEREKSTKEQHFLYVKKQAKKRRERIAGLTGKEKSFYSKIEKVKSMNISRYTMNYGEAIFLSELHGNSALNASYDTFCYGFYQGMKYLKNHQKKQKLTECGALAI